MNAWNAFIAGISRSLRYWQVLLMMFIAALLTALPLALLHSLGLLEIARRPVITDMADGIDAWQWVDLLSMVNQIQPAGGEIEVQGLNSSIQQGLAGIMFALFLLPAVGGVVSAFIYGGVLLVYSGAPQPFRWGRFFWGCWHWFGSFLLIGIVQALLFLLLPLPLIIVVFSLPGVLGDWSLWLLIPLLVLFLLFWMALFEQTRLRMVSTGSRNIFTGLAQAFGLLFRRPLALGGLYLLALALLVLVHLIFRTGALEFFPAALVLMQLYVLARLWVKAVRLAGSAALQQSWMGRQDAPQPEVQPI